ncbi:hypothetical protein HK16_10655 [Acetobacter senegalensis]|uniref:Uncharacterized protein n=2 Tax=Acetobacter TaxID=434 RepID=A0A252EJE0_9PROT|nr:MULTISPECIES: hypothetical protein [Acetobacter]ATJ89421.1 hypothetical protein CIW82_00490 [Acetobacter tropicalis]OUL66334.1 hypothetical protein HK16_10655 [Acetobacter senegalensis]
MALSKDRTLPEKKVSHAPEFALSVAAGFRVFRGSICIVCQDGSVVPAGTAAPPSPAVASAGIARHAQDNTGTSTVMSAQVGSGPIWCEKSCFGLPFDEAPTWADVGKPVFAVDDETVSLTETPASGAARLQVGTLSGLEADGTAYVLLA